MKSVRRSLLEREDKAVAQGDEVMLHNEVSPFIFISAAINIQEQQYAAACLVLALAVTDVCIKEKTGAG
jgi:hypothetical protein